MSMPQLAHDFLPMLMLAVGMWAAAAAVVLNTLALAIEVVGNVMQTARIRAVWVEVFGELEAQL